MTKILIALFVVGVAGYFFVQKRVAPPKDVTAVKEVIAPEDAQAQPEEPSEIQNTPLYHVNMDAVSTTVAPPSMDDLADAAKELETSAGTDKKDEPDEEADIPRENVDQTVIANEKKLAAANSGAEVFELLQKLRIRMKKLSSISTVAKTENYAKFFGSFEGPVINRRNESVYTLKLEIKQTSNISGTFEVNKGKDGVVKGGFNGDFGMQLVGRDGLVISDTGENNNFQLYKIW